MEESKSTIGDSPQKAPTIQFGLTEPISLAGPSKADIQRNAMLEKVYILRLIEKVLVNYC